MLGSIRFSFPNNLFFLVNAAIRYPFLLLNKLTRSVHDRWASAVVATVAEPMKMKTMTTQTIRMEGLADRTGR